MSRIGYARVSTTEGRQVLDRQLDALREAGCERIFEDHASGAAAERANLGACLDYLREGDVLVVLDLDRLGRRAGELIALVDELDQRGVGFLFNAMAPKEDNPFQGVPEMLYLDNGPVARSLVFQTVMDRLGVDWRPHMPAGSDGTRPTARSKGKVERPFRTVKEAHETLYHFHKPETEAEANAWLSNFVVKYNEKPHRREPHSRIEDWIANLPESGFREMCSWERSGVSFVV